MNNADDAQQDGAVDENGLAIPGWMREPVDDLPPRFSIQDEGIEFTTFAMGVKTYTFAEMQQIAREPSAEELPDDDGGPQ